MKKILSFILALNLMLLSFTFWGFALNEDAVEVKAKSAVLMDVSTGQVLYSFNENERLYPASVTKIMPMLLVMEALHSGKITLTDTVTTSTNAASKGGSQIWLKEGEQMTVDELLKATAIGSANDAVTALGEHLYGSEEAFVNAMNVRAEELGMINTSFENGSGLDDTTTNHLTTAHDIALMSRELLKHEKITDYTTVWMDSLRNGATELVNTNRLVRFYNGTTGLKTGTTSRAGHCLSASAKRDGLHLIAVVMGAGNSTDRFEGAKAMLNWGFSNYETVTPSVDSSLLTPVRVKKGVEAYVMPKAQEIKPLTLKKGLKDKTETQITISDYVEAPCEENQIIGKVVLKADGETVGEYNLLCEKIVERITFGVMALRFLKVLSKSL
ncbi:MAG: D-alanyl-D-alanine carboxypeptidase [Clostridia bacterium]|nr:D-alanyl-D-alanine carboxypeptidase [Clostridia bacterium]